MKEILKKNIFHSIVSRRIIVTIKYLIQAIKRLLLFKRKILTNKQYYNIRNGNKNSFYGYYDVNPFNRDMILYLTTVDGNETADIRFFNQRSKEDKIITHTHCWNWQQGCRLRWFSYDKEWIIFNDFDGKSYFSRITDLNGNEIKRINVPLYDISKDNKKGLSLNFEKLGVLRPGYGYTNKGSWIDVEKQDGILLVDIESNSIKMILSYERIRHELKSVTGLTKCYLNHLSFSPSGNRFLFFWIEIQGGRHQANMMVYDINNDELMLVEVDRKTSHYVWVDDDHIIYTAYDMHMKCQYYQYNLSSKSKCAMAPDILNMDGHPSMLNDHCMITDTYPDVNGYQHLFTYDFISNKKTSILDIYSNCIVEGEKRTDLHPRLSPDKTQVCVDVNYRWKRELMIINL